MSDEFEFLDLDKKLRTTMKYLAALFVMVMFVGCGDATEDITTEEIIARVNSTGSITDEQAESLSKVEWLELNGLTSITDEQAESLSKVSELSISEDLQPLIDKYKNQ